MAKLLIFSTSELLALFAPLRPRIVSGAGFCASLLIFALYPTQIAYSAIRIVEGGVAKAVIAIDPGASRQILDAAEELRFFIEGATGAVLPVVESDRRLYPEGQVVIRVKTSKGETAAGPFEDHGFVIDFPDSRTIVISGKSDSGTLFGIYEFLERFVGVRWLFPGPMGTDVPQTKNLEVPIAFISLKPVFSYREMIGFPNSIQKEWAKRMRLEGGFAFHHNMNRIIPPEAYTQTHPEFFPILNGKRFLPASNSAHGWQPCFTAPGVVEEAVKNICDYFEKKPGEASFSLGINDFGGFCAEDLKNAKTTEPAGYSDWAEIYFAWTNAVAEGVLERFPEKWFGCLAYDNVREPPETLSVHPRIIPFMTYDRLKWGHATERQAGQELTKKWGKKTHVLGWYEYIFGSVYHVPRIYFHEMAVYYRFGATNGVSAVYAEAYPNWGEGPKLYLAARLMWNPYLDVDQVLAEWYERAVGREAAPFLAAYYRIWEDFWTTRALKWEWFTRKGQFLPFWIPDYLELVREEDIAKSRTLLEAASSKAQTPKQKDRARLLLRAFEYYEASALSYLGLFGKAATPGIDYKALHRKRKTLVDEFDSDPVLVHPTRFDRKFPWADTHQFNKMGHGFTRMDTDRE